MDSAARSLDQHSAVVSRLLAPIAPLSVLVRDAAGATLVEPLVAAQDVPIFAVAAWDGVAVSAHDVAGAPVVLPVAHDVSFADQAPRMHVPGTAARVGSGMPLPVGADAVVPFASTDGGVARVRIDTPVTVGVGVIPAGADARAGQSLIPAGRRLGGRDVALAAALGLSRVVVRPVPRVVVMAVGSELVDGGVGRAGSGSGAAGSGAPGFGAARSGAVRAGVPESTAHLLAVAARSAGTQAVRVGPIADDLQVLRTAIEDQLVRADVILIAGGLSGGVGGGGTADSVVEALAGLGEVDATPLALDPGPRHAVALVGDPGARRVPVIALPGSPALAALGFEAYVRPALRRMCGFAEYVRPAVRARVERGWVSPAGVTQAVPVRLGLGADGTATAVPTDPAGPRPGRVPLAALGAADGIAWVGAHVTQVNAGDVLRCTIWDD